MPPDIQEYPSQHRSDMSRLSEMRTSHTRDRFLPRQIGDMDEGVVEGREDVRNAEH